MSGFGFGFGFGFAQQGTNVNHLPEFIKDGNTFAWYDISDLSTITKNGSNVVSRVNDKLGSGNDLVTGSCTWADNSINFDKTLSQYLKTASKTLNQPSEIWMVVDRSVWTENSAFFDGYTALRGMLYDTVGTPKVKIYAGAEAAENTKLVRGQHHIVRALFSGSNSELQVNETSKTTGNAGGNNLGGITIGSRGAGTDFTTMNVREMIIRKVASTQNQINETVTYLNRKHHILFDKAKFVFTFDDLYKSAYTLGLPLFTAKGIKGTFYVNMYYTGLSAAYTTWAENKVIYDAGHEIASHGQTHTPLTTLTEAQIRAEFNAVKSAFLANGMTEPLNVAYPSGQNDATVRAVASEFYRTGRSVSGLPAGRRTNHKYDIGVKDISQYTPHTLQSVKDYIDIAVADKSAIVFMIHEIVTGTPQALAYQINLTELTDIIDYIKSKDADILTMNQLADLMV